MGELINGNALNVNSKLTKLNCHIYVLENKLYLQLFKCVTKKPYLNPGGKVAIDRLRNTKMAQ